MTLQFSAITLCLAAGNALAQGPIDPPLKNWAAPLYWASSRDTGTFIHRREVNADTGSIPMQRTVSESTIGVSSSDVTTGALVFVAITPCRVIDTRQDAGFPGAFGPPGLAGGASRSFPMQSSPTCSIPASARAYSLNITVVPPGPVGYLTAYPTGQSLPASTILTDVQGLIVSNAAIVAGGASGSIDVYTTNQTDLVVDLNGYYIAPFTLDAAGSGDIAVGPNAGANLRVGSNDIYIGNPGVAAEDATIRIGDPRNQRNIYLAGIYTSSVTGAPVQVDSDGHLGVILSSRRYKEDIHDMLDTSNDIMRLRPVTFRYTSPGSGGTKALQYGLIAEEVAQVYPDLVVYSNDGQAETVQYQKLDVLLLNELQKQQRIVQEQSTQLKSQADRITALESLLHRKR